MEDLILIWTATFILTAIMRLQAKIWLQKLIWGTLLMATMMSTYFIANNEITMVAMFIGLYIFAQDLINFTTQTTHDEWGI